MNWERVFKFYFIMTMGLAAAVLAFILATALKGVLK